jgi:uncharacterized protein YegP (UPF0339 family)
VKLVDTLDLKSSDCNGRTGSSPVPSTKPLLLEEVFLLYKSKLEMSSFVITKRFNDEYKFEFTSRKGKTIFTSNSFELKFECEEEINFLKLNFENAVFLKSKSSSGKYFFRLLIEDRQLAISRKYSTQLMLEKGINEISKYMPKSEILDFSTNDFVFE